MSNLVTSVDYSRDYDPPAPLLEVGVSIARHNRPDITIKAMIDSGSDGTMMPASLLESIGAKPIGKGRIRGVMGNSQSVNIYLVKLYISTHQLYAIRVAGVEDEDEPLLGRNVMQNLVITLDGLVGVIEIKS